MNLTYQPHGSHIESCLWPEYNLVPGHNLISNLWVNLTYQPMSKSHVPTTWLWHRVLPMTWILPSNLWLNLTYQPMSESHVPTIQLWHRVLLPEYNLTNFAYKKIAQPCDHVILPDQVSTVSCGVLGNCWEPVVKQVFPLYLMCLLMNSWT